MTRTHSDSLARGGLNWDSLPLKLFAGGNAKFWNPADIDFSRDRADWERLSDDERHYATRLCAEFIAGEEAVTEDIQPFMSRDAGRRPAGRRDVPDAVRVRGSQARSGVPDVARRRRRHRQPAELSGRHPHLPHDFLRGVAGLPQRIVGRSLAGCPGPGVRHLQPHGRRHVGADRLLRLAQDLRGARHSSRDAGAGPAHR